jgi:hypothetical protein
MPIANALFLLTPSGTISQVCKFFRHQNQAPAPDDRPIPCFWDLSCASGAEPKWKALREAAARAGQDE